MNSDALKQEIRRAAMVFARKRDLRIDDSRPSAVIFRNLSDNFHPKSYANIMERSVWRERTTKAHQKVPNTCEMQSSNSSDALLMNIFCHPDVPRWKGIEKVVGEPLDGIVFGFRGRVRISGETYDSTEIDMAIPGAFCEGKLTESDFTRKRAEVVEKYDSLQRTFHVEALPRIGDRYDNYQIIRNLLASVEQNRRHILFCDERRPDLVRRYLAMALCLRDMEHRKKCRVVFWQELVSACNGSLRSWIEERYGM